MHSDPGDSGLHSCLYEGIVTHRRLQPFEHSFCYRGFWVYLDLDELNDVFRNRWLWSTSRPAVAWFRRKDHFGHPSQSLAEAVGGLVESRTGIAPRGPIRLLTQLRYYGYVMNPISIYYCFDSDGQQLTSCVAEVTNTPWGEHHCYVVADPLGQPQSEKQLHVSPFMPMEMRYRWRISTPEEQLEIGIENHDAVGCAFSAGMSMQRRPLSTWELNRMLIRYPFMTAKIAAAIYWQAARLWWKGAAFHSHPRLNPNIREVSSPSQICP